MADKETALSIVIRAVDKATAPIRAINQRINTLTAPIRQVGAGVKALGREAGFGRLAGAIKGVGSALADVAAKVGLVVGAAGAALVGLKSLVDQFDNLGDTAERIGVSVDFLAQMRFAAERSGASVEDLDAGLLAFNRSLGQASAGTGRFASFLAKVSPALLKQVKGAKSSEEAFDLMADAMAKIKDPAKRTALAVAAFGGTGAALAPLLGRGAAGVAELRDRFLELAGPQGGAADAAGKVDDSMIELRASLTGVKAALVQGLGPAFLQLIERLRAFLTENRERITDWINAVGEKLPGAIVRMVTAFSDAINFIKPVWDALGGLKGVAIALAVVLAGKLVLAVYALGAALLTTPIGWVLLGLAAISAAVIALVKNWDKVVAAMERAGVALGLIEEKNLGGTIASALGNRPTLKSGDVMPVFRGGKLAPSEARVKIDLANAPRGTRVTTDPQSTADVDLSVGYQMGLP